MWKGRLSVPRMISSGKTVILNISPTRNFHWWTFNTLDIVLVFFQWKEFDGIWILKDKWAEEPSPAVKQHCISKNKTKTNNKWSEKHPLHFIIILLSSWPENKWHKNPTQKPSF